MMSGGTNSSGTFGGAGAHPTGSGGHTSGSGSGGEGNVINIPDSGTCKDMVTCADVGANCGAIADGCGGILQCGDCVSPETCGGAGKPNVCGTFVCTPTTCAQAGADCGPIGDGCGGVLDCGTCSLPNTCGGSGTPSLCAIPASCTNLCLQQVSCSGNVTTTISGKVYAPGKGTGVGDPLLSALVYIPNAAVAPFAAGVTCDKCDANVSGSPLVSATTGPDGSFQLTNVPVGQNIPLVIQLGRWRRQVTIPSVTACQDNPVDAQLTRLPRNKSEGDIPKMAIATGSVDALECVLRKIGIDDAEFTQPSGDGRIHMYLGGGSAGANRGTGTPNESTLWGSQTTLNQYDMLLFPCQGNEYYSNRSAVANWPGMWDRLKAYTASGGRIFATHYSYVWLHGKVASSTTWNPGPGPWEGVATWNVDQSTPSDQDGTINMTFPKGQAFAQWLVNVGASTTLGQMPVKVVRHDADAVGTAQEWMSATNPAGIPLHFTFNTPVEAMPDDQCGRVVFSDFHVANASTGGKVFPAECDNTAMTPQEKLVEFMLFDLGSCVTPDIPTCTPKTCADLSIECGPAGDGCGGLIQCGDCPAGETCGGGGKPGVCGNLTCTPKTCAEIGAECGPVGDGCGAVLQCGECMAPKTCGGGGTPYKCGGGGPA
ncbi:Tryptophan synthase alpha chain [Minicystis rosea]|nr:Tryptophan synthase alpha chain [Minicystis rosea]